MAVVDAGGFAGAARNLNISPPVITRAVSELEEFLGVRLLTRTTRVVRVTEAGLRYAEDCRHVLHVLDEADRVVAGLHDQPWGQLTITAPGWFGAKFMAPIVAEYLDQYPKVTVATWFMDRVVNLIEEGVDLAVRFGELPDSSMQAISVGSMRLVICASPDYLEKRGTPLTMADMAQHSTIAATGVLPGAEWRLKPGSHSGDILKLTPRWICTSNETAVAAAGADDDARNFSASATTTTCNTAVPSVEMTTCGRVQSPIVRYRHTLATANRLHVSAVAPSARPRRAMANNLTTVAAGKITVGTQPTIERICCSDDGSVSVIAMLL